MSDIAVAIADGLGTTVGAIGAPALPVPLGPGRVEQRSVVVDEPAVAAPRATDVWRGT
jgi:hypothetical protein